MNKIFTIIFLIFIGYIYPKNTTTITRNSSGKVFKLTITDTTYFLNDQLKITLEIENKSDTPFWIIDFKKFHPSPRLYMKMKYIFYDIGGILNLQLNIYHKLRAVYPREVITYPLIVDLNELDLELTNDSNTYFIYVSIGCINFIKKIEYLTKGNFASVPLKNNEDASILLSAHEEIFLGLIPITIKK